MENHCKECGYGGQMDEVDQRGSDVIPVHECPECGDVAAIGCSCEEPEAHEGGA